MIVRPLVRTSMSRRRTGAARVPLSNGRPGRRLPEARVQVARSGQGRLGSEERQRRTERHGDHGAPPVENDTSDPPSRPSRGPLIPAGGLTGRRPRLISARLAFSTWPSPNQRRHPPKRAPAPPTAPARSARPAAASRSPAAGDGGEEVVRIRGDRDDVFSHGFICPKGSTLEAAARGSRPAAPAAGQARRRASSRSTWDEAFAEIERRPARRSSSAHGRDAVGVYLGNPNAHNLGAHALHRPRAQGARHARTCSRRAPSTSARRRSSAGLMFGGASTVPVPDIDRTDYLLMLGANPYASNGSLATAPDWPGRLEAIIARGRQASSSSTPAAAAPPRRPTSTCPSGPAPTPPARGDRPRAVRRGPRRPRRPSPSTSPASTRSSSAARAVHARGGRAAHRHRRRRRSGALARELAAAPTAARVRPHRHHARPSSARSRQLAGRRAQRRSPATSTGPAARCSPRPRPAQRTPAASPASAAGVRSAPPPQPGARAARDARRAAGGRAWPRRSRRRATARSGRWSRRRQPGAVDAEPRPARRRAGDARVHGVGRHLRQRDHPPRRRDPARCPTPLQKAPLRPRAAPARAPQRRQLPPAGAARSTTASPTSGRCWPGSRSIAPGRWAPTPTRRSSTT